MLALIILGLFLGLVIFDFPIFIAMGISALAGNIALGQGLDSIVYMASSGMQALSAFVLVAVPLYVLVGTLAEEAGLSDKLFTMARAWIGSIRGGLGVTTIAACAIFAAISGSSVATAATIGVVALPNLTRSGYRKEYSGAIIASGGTLGILIPPSIGLIIYGYLTEQSIGALFVAGVVPGLIIAALMGLYTMLFPSVTSRPPSYSFRQKMMATKDAIWVLALPVFVLVSVYTGFATPTEVGALAVVYVVLIGLMTRTLTTAGIWRALIRGSRTSAMILMLIAFGQMFTVFFIQTGLPQKLVMAVGDSGLSYPYTVLLMIALFTLLGTFLEATSMMLISVPILFPLAEHIGFNPLAFGIFIVLAVETAQITPPIGINLFTLSGIGNIPLGKLSKNVVPYIFILLVMMFAVANVPTLATWLPGYMR